MKRILQTLIILFTIIQLLNSCDSGKSRLEKFTEKSEKQKYIDSLKNVQAQLMRENRASKITSDPKTDVVVKKEIKKEENIVDSALQADYFYMSPNYQNGYIGICDYDLYNIDVLNLDEFKYVTKKNSSETIKKYDVYTYKNSFLKKHFYDHPDENREVIVCGRIYSEDVELSKGLKIGMLRDVLINKLFDGFEYADSINTLEVFEDERGNFSTLFLFEEGKLAEINFKSSFECMGMEFVKNTIK